MVLLWLMLYLAAVSIRVGRKNDVVGCYPHCLTYYCHVLILPRLVPVVFFVVNTTVVANIVFLHVLLLQFLLCSVVCVAAFLLLVV
jgi:hypothetical protein